MFNFFQNLPKEEKEKRLKIAQEIHKCGGPIPYLGLDNEKRVEYLTKTFKWDLPGIEVFRRLIEYRFNNGKPAYSFPYNF
ncbi:MAG: hypothetical protein H5T45_04375 [Thermoplasmatales archaeon]|nr:hypothetical protein [Thermoplasmatales archaeon]